ncbi:hypothetical protein RSAG8_09588, partial [Rhizoctonia solani AG-8 WAC10335]
MLITTTISTQASSHRAHASRVMILRDFIPLL